MKFTKTLAIGLLTLGAMQLMNAELIKLDQGTTMLPRQKGDVVEFNLKENPTTGYTISIAQTPNYIEVTTNEFIPPISDRVGAPGSRHIKLTITQQPTHEPLIIQNKRGWSDEVAQTYTIYFNKPTNFSKPTRTLNFTDKTGDVTYPDTEKGEDAPLLKVGDLIDLVFNENRMVSEAEKREIKINPATKKPMIPKFMELVDESFDAPSMDMVGGAGKHHMIFLVKAEPTKSLGERLRLVFGDKSLNIKFIVVEKPEPVIAK